MPVWDDILTPRDKEVFALSGFGKEAGLGQRPALLIIDVNYNFTGDKPEPILTSVKRFRTSCELLLAVKQLRRSEQAPDDIGMKRNHGDCERAAGAARRVG